MKNVLRAAAFVAAATCAAPALAQTTSTDNVSIAAVVNGQVITTQDVAGRALLLAMSAGMPVTPDALARLEPQVTSMLIDETLKLQEIDKLGVTVPESDVAGAISRIEQNNSLPPGGLRAKLAAAGVPFGTLVAQIRIQLGWQNVLHQVLGPGLQPTQGDLNAQKTAMKAQIGSTQYHISEIFVPVTGPGDETTARNFTNAIIARLRTGAPFPVIAAQFSQAQTALQGGDMGFVELNQLDKPVADVVATMPVGAISNPVRVPGGYDIVQLQATHQVGTEMQTILSIRQAFAQYPQPITNGQVGPVQAVVINKLMQAAHGAHSCDDMTAVNAAFGNIHPADPGPVNLATVTPPAFQSILANLAPGQISEPLVASDGVSVVMMCGRQSQAATLPSDNDIAQMIVEHRVELESQQLLDELHHRSLITQQ